MSDLSDLKNESLNIENHFTTQKANQPTFKNKVHSYKDENTKLLLYYTLSFMIPLHKGCPSEKGTIFSYCKHLFSLQI